MNKKEFEEFHKNLNKQFEMKDKLDENIRKEKARKKVNRWKNVGIWSAFHSLWCFLCGVWKASVYFNSDNLQVNVYVGGDAYNYIINACQATALWVLSGVFLIAAFGCAYIYYTKKKELKNNM